MKFTSDELAVILESLREYRLRLPLDSTRRILCEALVFRLGAEMVEAAKSSFLSEGT